jgi:protein involved in polysaccharide export with SLBB domain
MVWKNPDLSKQVTVPPDGNVSFPLIGTLQRWEKPEPNCPTYVLGDVVKPGKYPLKSIC